MEESRKFEPRDTEKMRRGKTFKAQRHGEDENK
jgi:hypothetical protein